MVIEFPAVDIGGAPPTERGTPDGGAAFSALVEDLLAEESASPEEVDADLADSTEPPPFEAAALFIVPPPLVNVPTPNAWPCGEGPFDGLAQTADNAGAESAGSPAPVADPTGLHAAAFGASVEGAAPRSVPTPAALLPAAPSWLLLPESASATPPPLRESGVDVSATSAPGVAVPESLLPLPAAEDAGEGEPSAPTAKTVQLVAPEADPTGPVEASQDDRTPRKDARGHVERPSAWAADAVTTEVDAVQRAGALVGLGLDLGSPARDGSRDGASSAPSHGAVPVVPAGPAATSTAGAAPQATWMPKSQADDVVLPQLVRAMRLQLVGGVGEARIQLDPEHLGAVTVNLRVEGGVVSAVVTAEQSAVRQWIENHETSLRQTLAEQGLVLGKLHVERDGRPPGEHPSQGRDDTPRRRSPRKDTATFELLA